MMKKPPAIGFSLATGALLAAPLVALNYLLTQLTNIPFVPFALFNWITPRIPGPIITFGIDAMIDTMLFLRVNVADSAKAAEQAMAVLLYLVIATAGFGLAAWLRRSRLSPQFRKFLSAAAVLALAVPSIAVAQAGGWDWLQGLVLLILYAIPAVVILLTGRTRRRPAAVPRADETGDLATVEVLSRRQFLITLGTSAAAITVAGTGLGALLAADDRREDAGRSTRSSGRILPNAAAEVEPAPGTRPEYTPVEEHYQVFLELEPREIPAEGYQLPVTGLVRNPVTLTLDDLYSRYESFDQYITLSCISGRVGTTLISTTKWTGFSLQDLLAEVDPLEEARYLYIESADGFFESVPLDLIQQDRRIMLCHSWDDNPLPTGHGFPCRIWIPDRFGMKQPKWIVKMELVSEYVEGYWVERGWDEIAQVKATSVIDTVAVNSVGLKNGERVIPVGGIAWAGDRQISRVEVRVDGGSWEEAALRDPLSETTWVIWRYDWPFSEGNHLFEVRCFEGDGTPQIAEASDARPSGATGIHSREADV